MLKPATFRRNNGKFDGKYVTSRKINLFPKIQDEEMQQDFVNECENSHVGDLQNDNQELDWRQGRRVVELGYLADQLKQCKNCSSPLFLHNCDEEKKCGLGSILYVVCQNCPYRNPIFTGKRHRPTENKKKGMQVWDINTKLSLAYVDAGMGPVQTVNFITALNLPTVSITTLKSREREIGKTLEEYAKWSCQKALEKEIALSKIPETTANIAGNEETEVDGQDAIHVSFDGAWQKRGSGRCYNSLTGHATLLGETTGKCVNFGLKYGDCRKCDRVDEKGDGHDCRINHQGSAKSMESELAVQMVKEIQKTGCEVSSITMDDDSTTIARLRKEEKSVARSHRTTGKAQKCSMNVVNYLTKDFSYALSQNKGNPENLRKVLKSIIPHAFGDHILCDKTWCQYHKNPDTYKHKSLPYGKNLTGEELRNELNKLFDIYASNSEKLSHLGSSQGNESLNNMIALKAPKAKHFGGSESLGVSVLPLVLPRRTRVAHILQRQGRKIKKEKSKEIREGKTYESGVSSATSFTNTDDNIIEFIPPPEPEAEAWPIPLKETTCVYFDLETTGFDRKQTGKRFNQESLVLDILGVKYDAHNAVGDVKSLQQLVEHFSLTNEKITPHSFSVEYVSQSVRQLISLNKRLASFTIPASVLSKGMDSSIETRCLDIGNWDNTRKVIEEIGQVDLLVNNAAILGCKTVLEVTEEFIDEHFDVNFKAAVNISQIVAKGIVGRKGSGAIVNISSISGFLATPGYPMYCTTKAAMDMLTKSMALEFGPLKIRVNSCNPSGLLTPMGEKLWTSPELKDAFTGRIPMGRFIEPEEVANTAAFLLSDYASMINGALVPVDGGHIPYN
ncbi:Hypothetical predicted protein [Mytilus galloprovincialis]|uniref:Mutator-like transposase domain-containing protein n=1 Tax=Mytilus galloprovincialis TaxID=29158 RepID=A0A8B6BXB9_MYTGA|nr:Hypothetical predicted protein [Mytilus galloprovincialis]